MKRAIKKFVVFIFILAAGFLFFTCGTSSNGGAGTDPRPAKPESMSGKTALQFFVDNDIKAGWNLGNTMDAVRFNGNTAVRAEETAWGNPQASQQLFNGVKQSGFDVVRIPCTWIGHIGPAPDYRINEDRLRRIAQIINCAKNAGIKATIINIHHDGNYTDPNSRGIWGFLDFPQAVKNPAKKAEVQNQIGKVWTQIAEYFKNYGDYLIFETLNEVHNGNWGNGDKNDPGYQNQQNIIFDWNQAALSAIRATGGNNASRFVAVPGLGSTEPEIVIAAHERGKLLPGDGANGADKLIVSVHYYAPSQYTVADAWTSEANGGLRNAWGSPEELNNLAHEIESLKTTFINNGILVYIGEWGAPTNARSGKSAEIKQTHLNYINSVAAAARANNVVPILWDDGGNFKMLERSNGTPKTGLWADVLSAIMNAMNSGAH